MQTKDNSHPELSSTPSGRPIAPNIRGVLAMLAAMATFIVGDATMKLASERLPTGEAMFLRGLIAGSLIWYLAWRAQAIHLLGEIPKKLLTLRSIGDAGGSLLYQSALARMPFADASAILQLNPLLVTAGAAIFLHEKVGWRRWTATAVGLIGVMLIIRPGSASFTWASMLVIAAVICSTMRDLVTRQMAMGIPTILITALATTAITISTLLLLPFEVWRKPTIDDMAFLTLPALCMLAGQFLVVYSIRSGEVSTVVPFRYSAILWALLLSFVIWNHIPDTTTLVGIAIVVCAGLYTLYREHHLRRLDRKRIAAKALKDIR
ncbi:MAG: DMT family transporter [Hyphomicrobiaceae bacterium]|nr:DMT family transporter [Hyphomicrobiaceae bacterium]